MWHTEPEFGHIWLEILNSQFTEVIYLSKCPCAVGLSFLNYNNFRYCFVVLSPWTYTQAYQRGYVRYKCFFL